jgi:hypothetical protein
LQRPDDDLRRADELSDADDRRVGQRRGRRHLQAFERLLPLRARNCVDAEREQIVGQQHRGAFAEPKDLRVTRHRLERHHQDA